MKYFLAAGGMDQFKLVLESESKNLLTSYFYLKQKEVDFIKANSYNNVFIDSGAFSAASSGKSIDINDYIKFIKENGFETFSVLDVIRNPAESKKNWLYMEGQRSHSIPCFHINTDIEYLKFYLDNSSRISIGGMVKSTRVIGNLDKIFNLIMNRAPDCYTHGFGFGSPNIAISYPWSSFDSSTFNAITKFRRASRWEGTRFEQINTFVLLEEMKVPVENEKITPEIRHMLQTWQIAQFEAMVKWVNQKQVNKIFHFKNQQTLF